MRAALGVLGWVPAVFWSSTPHELVAAFEGANPETEQRVEKQKRMKALEDKVRRGHHSK